VQVAVLTDRSRAAVEAALAEKQVDTVPGSGPRLVVFDGRGQHVLDAGSPGLTDVRDELLAMSPAQTLPACAALAVVAELIVDADPGVEPRTFVERLGEQTAGVRAGLRGIADLASGGEDHLRGDGFRDDLDDGTAGQVRHFAGVAEAAARFGGDLTQGAARHLLGDDRGGADASLTEQALEFVRRLESGELTPRAAGGWIRRQLCEGAPP